MCNRYTIRGDATEVANALDATLPLDFSWDEEVLPRAISPGLILADGIRELVPMQFALAVPGAPKPSDPKWANNNARVEKYDQWPWKEPMKSRRCVVPLSKFREPCYWGETAGKEVNFYSPTDDYLGVACIYNLWRVRKTDEPLVTMTFFMRPASDFIMRHGHHRQPFFIRPEVWDVWMAPEERKLSESVSILRDAADEPELAFEVVREMARSWKSRQTARTKKRDEQLSEIERTGLALGI